MSNPFDKINEMKVILQQEAAGVKPDDTITYREHFQRMLNMLSILLKELENAGYNYVIEDEEKGMYHTFEELTIKSMNLTDELIVVRPVAVDTMAFDQIDMESLYNVLAEMKNAGQIKENIIVLPPNVEILRAKLSQSREENNEENVT